MDGHGGCGEVVNMLAIYFNGPCSGTARVNNFCYRKFLLKNEK